MKIRNCSPVGAPLVLDGHGEVAHGQTIEVTDELGAALTASSSSWEKAPDEAAAATPRARKASSDRIHDED